MFTNEILEEKYRVQKKLSEKVKDIHDYIQKNKRSRKCIEKQYAFKFNYVTQDHIPLETITK